MKDSIKSILILFSYHHNNTEKIAKTFAKVLDAQIKSPEEVKPEGLQDYDLIGFGSGIYYRKHHKVLLEFVENLPPVKNKKAFIFSTSGSTRKVTKNHLKLREKLESNGYIIVDEFNCAGFDTVGPLRLFGGIKKGRPNEQDLKDAEEFAKNLKQNM